MQRRSKMQHHTQAGSFSALNTMKSEGGSNNTRPSKRLQAKRAAQTPTVRRASVQRAYFVVGAQHPLWDVGLDAILQQVQLEGVWMERVDLWIADVALACACIRGDQSAWSELITRHVRSLCEGAELRLSPQQSRLLVERFIRELRASTLAVTRRGFGTNPAEVAEDLSLQSYGGGQTLARWLLAHILARIETMPLGLPLSVQLKCDRMVARGAAGKRDIDGGIELESVASILDSVPPPRTLVIETSACGRVPQAT
jgi:hypothetical protein